MKKFLSSGAMYFLIAVMFLFGALNRTVSDNSFVFGLLVFCAATFTLLGILELRKKDNG